MSKQVDSKKIVDTKTKAPEQKAQPAKPKPAEAKPAPAAPAKAAPAPAKAAPAPAKGALAAPAKAAPVDPKAQAQTGAPQKSAIHAEIDKIVVDATKNFADKKTTKTEIVSEVKEIKIVDDHKKTINALVVYLPYVYFKNHRALLSKIVNDIQAKKKLPTFAVSQRTMIHKKSDYKQKIPRNRTLSSVYDSILEDLISPGVIIGKRFRYHLDGSQLIKVFLNEESKGFLESKLGLITQIYHKLTNRKVSFEFRHEISYIKVPLIKAPRAKITKKGGAKKDAGQAPAPAAQAQ